MLTLGLALVGRSEA
jgi:hypothetical protein